MLTNITNIVLVFISVEDEKTYNSRQSQELSDHTFLFQDQQSREQVQQPQHYQQKQIEQSCVERLPTEQHLQLTVLCQEELIQETSDTIDVDMSALDAADPLEGAVNSDQCNVYNKDYQIKRILIKKPMRKKLFECEQCDKKFYTPLHLRIHTRRHTDKKPFECTIASTVDNEEFTEKCKIFLHVLLILLIWLENFTNELVFFESSISRLRKKVNCNFNEL